MIMYGIVLLSVFVFYCVVVYSCWGVMFGKVIVGF